METNQTPAQNKKVFIAAIIVLAIMNAINGYFLFSEKHDKNELAVEKKKVEQNYSNLEQD